MSSESKKCLIWLGGALGMAVIIVLTVLALQMILQRNAIPPVLPTAQVTSVKPHYISATIPKRECRQVQRVVYVSQAGRATGAGAVIGGVAGGLLGSQVGGGDGRIVTSAAGAAIGALTGNSVENSMNVPQPHAVYSTVCSTHDKKTTIQKGYEITYSYDGKQGVIIMNDPLMIGSVVPFPIK